MGHFLLSIASAESLSWTGFIVLAIALLGETAVIIIPTKFERLHKELAFIFAVLAAGGYAVERIGDDAIVDALKTRASNAEETLNKLTSDRILSDKQIQTIVQKIRSFEGQEYDIVTFWEMREPLALANRIHAALQLSAWKYVQPISGISLLGNVEGVQVWVHPITDEQIRKAAIALVDVLNELGMAATLKEQNPNNPKDNKISITVGTKP